MNGNKIWYFLFWRIFGGGFQSTLQSSRDVFMKFFYCDKIWFVIRFVWLKMANDGKKIVYSILITWLGWCYYISCNIKWKRKMTRNHISSSLLSLKPCFGELVSSWRVLTIATRCCGFKSLVTLPIKKIKK